jgi:hypothetical protein
MQEENKDRMLLISETQYLFSQASTKTLHTLPVFLLAFVLKSSTMQRNVSAGFYSSTDVEHPSRGKNILQPSGFV